VAYVVTNLLEDVINRGTAAGVRGRGFAAPAAGKTGTSHDGWFAGFTSNLLCVVWVGFDDNRELGLSGASAAAPIWTEFMKRAVQFPAYRGTQEFVPPEGVSVVTLDADTLEVATASCPNTVQEVFLTGSEPRQSCAKHGGGIRSTLAAPVNWLAGIFGTKSKPAVSNPPGTGVSTEKPMAPAAPAAADPAKAVKPEQVGAAEAGPAEAAPEDARKKGVFSKIFGIFGGKKEKEKAKPEPASKPPSP
jgi:penicillin-binding protein 1B